MGNTYSPPSQAPLSEQQAALQSLLMSKRQELGLTSGSKGSRGGPSTSQTGRQARIEWTRLTPEQLSAMIQNELLKSRSRKLPRLTRQQAYLRARALRLFSLRQFPGQAFPHVGGIPSSSSPRSIRQRNRYLIRQISRAIRKLAPKSRSQADSSWARRKRAMSYYKNRARLRRESQENLT